MDHLINALKAIAEPTRMRILALCLKGELTVSELVRILGQSQPRISRHLKLLSEAGLLTRIREGSWVFHRISQSGTGADLTDRLADLIPHNDSLIERDMERLAEVKKARSESAAAYFREIATQWDAVRTLHVDEAEIDDAIASSVDWDRVSSMIDLGTGTGHLLEQFGPRIETGEGIDMSREMLAIARSNLEHAGLPHCQVRQGDIFQLPNESESFDLAIIHQVLHFVDDQSLAIDEANRVLKPGGQLVVVDFAPHNLEALRDNDNHRRLGFSDQETQSWFRNAGLVQKSITKLDGSPLTVCIWSAEKPPRTPVVDVPPGVNQNPNQHVNG